MVVRDVLFVLHGCFWPASCFKVFILFCPPPVERLCSDPRSENLFWNWMFLISSENWVLCSQKLFKLKQNIPVLMMLMKTNGVDIIIGTLAQCYKLLNLIKFSFDCQRCLNSMVLLDVYVVCVKPPKVWSSFCLRLFIISFKLM